MDSILFIGKSFNFFKDDADYKNRQRAQACLDFYDSFSNFILFLNNKNPANSRSRRNLGENSFNMRY